MQGKLTGKRIFSVPQVNETNFITITQICTDTFRIRLNRVQPTSIQRPFFFPRILFSATAPTRTRWYSHSWKKYRVSSALTLVACTWRHNFTAKKWEKTVPALQYALILFVFFSSQICPEALVLPSPLLALNHVVTYSRTRPAASPWVSGGNNRKYEVFTQIQKTPGGALWWA